MPERTGPRVSGARLDRDFYARDPRTVAPELLGKVLIHGRTAGRIVETEAYCGVEDPGAHTYRGRTERNATMFAPGGHLYVYFTYGMHWCANAVCGEEGDGVAVLIRALAPVAGLDEMHVRRGPAARRVRDLCSGPAKLAQALGIGRSHDGIDLVTHPELRIVDDGLEPPGEIVQTTRIGLTHGAEHRWRWYVAGDPNVSRR